MIESVSHVSLNLFRHCPVRICALLCAISMAQPATAEAEAPPAQAVYESLGPDFTVNLKGSSHYVRVGVQVSTKNPDTVEEIKTHQAALRHAMVLLFSEQTYKGLRKSTQQHKLRLQALDAAISALDEVKANSELTGLYFTRFVME